MRRRDLLRHTLAGGAAAGSLLASGPAATVAPVVREFPEGYDASQALARADWRPVFLDAHQDATLVALADCIIPETDTPGAKQALVNRFIDRLLAAETLDVRRDFLASLAFLDGECLDRYRTPFKDLAPETRTEFLKFLAYPHSLVTWGDNRSDYAGHEHFRRLKGWISRTYYGSAAGQRELGGSGSVFHGDFGGCPHPPGTHA